ncbi:hypothetical protein OG21DRAFT_1419752, partial [Imleria badia]
KALFEGFFSFNVCYGSMYRKASHGDRAKYEFALWSASHEGQRGKEIVLGPTKEAHVVNHY